MSTLGRLTVPPAVRELRLHLCQTSAASKGARDFVQRCYVPLKTANRRLPILVRECSGVRPALWARYAYGVERHVPLDDKQSAEAVLDVVRQLADAPEAEAAA